MLLFILSTIGSSTPSPGGGTTEAITYNGEVVTYNGEQVTHTT